MDFETGGNRDLSVFLRDGVHPALASAAWHELRQHQETFITVADFGLSEVFFSVYQPRAVHVDICGWQISTDIRILSKDMSEDLGAACALDLAALLRLATASATNPACSFEIPTSEFVLRPWDAAAIALKRALPATWDDESSTMAKLAQKIQSQLFPNDPVKLVANKLVFTCADHSFRPVSKGAAGAALIACWAVDPTDPEDEACPFDLLVRDEADTDGTQHHFTFGQGGVVAFHSGIEYQVKERAGSYAVYLHLDIYSECAAISRLAHLRSLRFRGSWSVATIGVGERASSMLTYQATHVRAFSKNS